MLISFPLWCGDDDDKNLFDIYGSARSGIPLFVISSGKENLGKCKGTASSQMACHPQPDGLFPPGITFIRRCPVL
jgi:hypothetical protein